MPRCLGAFVFQQAAKEGQRLEQEKKLLEEQARREALHPMVLTEAVAKPESRQVVQAKSSEAAALLGISVRG